jgi:hypothetical protein
METRTKIILKIENGSRPTLSGIMKAYQAARKAIKSGALKSDLCRLNRALGLTMTKVYDRPYATTTGSCNCPDSCHHVCKHQLRRMLMIRAFEMDGAK